MPPPIPDRAPVEAEPLRAVGWDDRWAAFWADAPGGARPGRVVRSDRGRVVVLTASGTEHAVANAAGWPGDDETRSPTTGDWVAIGPPADDEGEPVATLLGVLPRASAIRRLDALGRAEQVLAANVDLVFVVHGLDRPMRPGRLERSLVLAWESGAQPVVVVTKTDLVADTAPVLDELADLTPGVDVVAVSARDGSGIDAIRTALAGHRTAVLLGESGAGKSTLVNRLLGEDVQATADVRSGDAKGRHTTVTRDLLALPGGGVLIDTPGLRSLGLGGEVDEGLALAFSDVEAFAGGCRFGDCRHESEPGCAVQAAVAAGDLDAERVARYLDLRAEADAAETRQDEAARRERKRQDKVQARAIRRYYRDR